jgi:hypothetical protein
LRFGDSRHGITHVNHGLRSGIISGQEQIETRPKSFPQQGEIAHPCFDIVLWIEGIGHPERRLGRRHELHQALRPAW